MHLSGSLTPRRVVRRASLTICMVVACVAVGPRQAAAQQPSTEGDYYRIESLPIPEGIILEVGGLALMESGSLAVSTRRGEVWIVENPVMDGGARPHFRRFASGLHEPLGLAYRDGVFYVAQRGELTRLRDTNGDGRADQYESIYQWPLDGNYHEYSYGPLLQPDGTMLVTLNLAWVGRGASLSKWRGWMLALSPEGTMTPVATGMRSPAGFGVNAAGDVFYAENQGDWVGSGYITHVERGDFVGNPAGLRWTDDPASPLRLNEADVPDTGQPMVELASAIPALKPPAVWFPHSIMGISTSDILVDDTDGAFGPFGGQLYVGDQGQSKVMRVYLEKVKGVYQGVVFPFLEGFASGVLRLAWGTDGAMFVGMTNRGWGSTGQAPFGLQRVTWTGKRPFEAERIEARPDGFEVFFTRPADAQRAASSASYQVTGFTYKYHSEYGSPIINQADAPIQGVRVAPDRMSARLVVSGLREGYIHEIKMAGVRDQGGQPLLHDTGYYTLNRLPDGPRLALAPAASGAAPVTTTPVHKQVAGPKHQTTEPPDWDAGPDVALTISPEPGLTFDLPAFDVRAGSRIALTFNNDDDMLHNLLVVSPGAADAVADAALAMGLQGPARAYVPESEDVLFHTSLLQPETAETIFFQAPAEPGTYTYICTFPGHATTMRGVMRVVAP